MEAKDACRILGGTGAGDVGMFGADCCGESGL